MKVFYHNDNDGKCAGHIIDRFYNLDPPDHASQLLIKFYPMEYGKQFPFEDISKDEKVYILDYSIEPFEMERLMTITKDIIWIDHHKSSIDKYYDLVEKLNKQGLIIEGIRDIIKSGCELTWDWFHRGEEIPQYVKLIGDRDTWRWEHGDTTKFFHYGITASDNDPCDPIWLEARKDTGSIIENGKAVFGYVRKQNIEAIKDCGFWFYFHGHKTLALNSDTVRSSEFFEEFAPEATIWMSFRFIPKHNATTDGYWTVSIYSTKTDVSEIAKQYQYEGKRGGGHKGASGFQSADLSFLGD